MNVFFSSDGSNLPSFVNFLLLFNAINTNKYDEVYFFAI